MVLKSDITFDTLKELASVKPCFRFPTSELLKQSCSEILCSNTVWIVEDSNATVKYKLSVVQPFPLWD